MRTSHSNCEPKVPTAVNQIAANLHNDGYCVGRFQSYDDFCACVDLLGRTLKVVKVKIQPERTELLFSHDSMTLHNDHPDANYIGWYCSRPAKAGGHSIFLDTRALLADLDEAVLADLSTIRVRVPPRIHGGQYGSETLLSSSGVYYANWLLDLDLTRSQVRSIELLQNKINDSSKCQVKLKKGEALFIDNKRVLHGRAKIQEATSARLLIRHWIAAP